MAAGVQASTHALLLLLAGARQAEGAGLPCDESDLFAGWPKPKTEAAFWVADRPEPTFEPAAGGTCAQVVLAGASLGGEASLAFVGAMATELANSSRSLASNLEVLDLAGITLGDGGAEALARALPHVVAHHNVTLLLSRTGIGSAGGAALAAVLARAKTLDLDWNEQLGDDGVAAIAAALQGGASGEAALTESLGLERCGLGDAAAGSLGAALRVNGVLADLALEGNAIGADGAASLAAALPLNRGLRRLGLGRNPIGAAGARSLAVALRRRDSRLTSLDLAGCAIGDEGAVALATALRSNTALRVLNLLGNGIGAAGARALASALRINRSLAVLGLQLNVIGAAAASSLLDALTDAGDRSAIAELELGENYAPADADAGGGGGERVTVDARDELRRTIARNVAARRAPGL